VALSGVAAVARAEVSPSGVVAGNEVVESEMTSTCPVELAEGSADTGVFGSGLGSVGATGDPASRVCATAKGTSRRQQASAAKKVSMAAEF